MYEVFTSSRRLYLRKYKCMRTDIDFEGWKTEPMYYSPISPSVVISLSSQVVRIAMSPMQKEVRRNEVFWRGYGRISELRRIYWAGFLKCPTGCDYFRTDNGDYTTEGNPLECPFDEDPFIDDFANEKLGIPKTCALNRLEFCERSFQPQNIREMRTLLRRIRNGDENLIKSLGLESEQKNPIGFIREITCEDNDLVMIAWHKDIFLELRAYQPFYAELATFDLKSVLITHLPILSSVEKFYSKPSLKQLYAVYKIDEGESESRGKVFFEFAWSEVEPSKVLYGVPPVYAKSKISICPNPDDADMDLKSFWKDISNLKHKISIFESLQLSELCKMYRNPDVSSENLEDCRNMDIISQIQELVQQPTSTSWTLSKETDTSFRTVLESVIKGDRADVDFTDQAWNLLKGSDIPAIYDGLTEIFSIIERGYWKPYLLPTNKTEFVKILKDLHTGKLDNFRSILNPKLALQMVIEFGIMKLERDFIFICTMCHLLNRNEEPKSLDVKKFQECVLYFQKLYCLVEIIGLANSKFGLLPRDHQHFAQTFYKQILGIEDFDWTHVYHFDHPNDRMIPLLATGELVYRSLRIQNEGTLRKSYTTIIFSRDSMAPQSQRKQVFQTMDRLEGETKPWFPYVYSVLERRSV